MLIVSVLAIYRGHYMAVLLGMVSGLCVTVATIWYVAPGADHVASTPASVRTQARSSQPGLGWILFDGALVGIFPFSLLLLAIL